MISNNYVPLRQIGNGATVDFSSNWNIIAPAYLRVYLESVTTGVQVLQVLGVNYTLVYSDAGFTVTFISGAPTSANYVVIGRAVALDQTDPYRTSRGFQGEVVEASFDKLTAALQDQQNATNRSLYFPLGDTTSGALPTAAARANLALLFDALGAPTVGAVASAIVSAPMIPVVAASSTAAALALLGGVNAAGVNALAPKVNNFRLSLTTGVAVTTADVISATTVYLVPFNGNAISLFSAGAWSLYLSSQVSIALGTLISGRPYDVFAYSNAGVVALELLAWTNATTRATALTYQDGVRVKTGDATRRYIGTFYTTSTTTTEDSFAKRFLVSYENTVPKVVQKKLAADTAIVATSITEVSSTLRNEFIVATDDRPPLGVVVSGGWSVNGAATGLARIGVDGVASLTFSAAATATTAASSINLSDPSPVIAAGYHYTTLGGYHTGGTNVVFFGTTADTNITVQTTISA